MTITVCTLHPDCAVTHDDATVCPVCVAIDNAADRTDNAADMLDQARVLMAPLVALLFPSVDRFTPAETPRPTGEVKVTITTEPEPVADPGPSRKEIRDECLALEARLSPADINAIRLRYGPPAVGVNISKQRGRVPDYTSYRDALRSAVATLETAPRPTAPTEEPTFQSVQPDPDENVVEEPEPTERDTWIRDRIRAIKDDPSLQTWGALAELRAGQTGSTPAISVEAPTLRALIAEYEYDHRPVEESDTTTATDDIPF